MTVLNGNPDGGKKKPKKIKHKADQDESDYRLACRWEMPKDPGHERLGAG